MNDLGDAIGTAVEGGLYAKAVDKTAYEGKPTEQGQCANAQCLNCGTELIGSHCHSCGQRAHLHRTVRGFLHDLVHGVLHFEGKFWRTLPMLAWHPGRLTRRYIDGERAKFVGPIAVFLFVVFISFAVFQLAGGSASMVEAARTEIDPVAQMEREYVRRGQELADKRAEFAEAQGESATALNEEIQQLEKEYAGVGGALQKMGSDMAPNTIDGSNVTISVQKSNSWQSLKENPQLLAYKIQTNAYKFSWLLIPLSAPFVWLLYFWKRRFKMYDHVVFTTYSISFMLVLAGVSATLIYYGTFLKYDGLQLLGVGAMLYAPVHMYRHVRGTYESSRLGSFLRMLALSLFAWVALALFAWVLVLLA